MCLPFDLVLYIKTKIKTVFKMGKKPLEKAAKTGNSATVVQKRESFYIYINIKIYI